MSTEQFNKKCQQGTKLAASLKKDLKYRQEQFKRGEATYSTDAQIKGSLQQLNQITNELYQFLSSNKANAKQLGLSTKELQRRQKEYEKIKTQESSLRKTYDSFFQKKSTVKDLIGDQSQNPVIKPNTNNMTKQQLKKLKQQNQQQQEQVVDDLIGVVQVIKGGAKAIGKQLQQQDVMLNKLDDGIDQNTQKMGAVRRKMVKLLQSSSNMCLIVTIIIQIAAIVCILLLWNTN